MQISKALAGADRKDLMRKLPKFIYDEEKTLEVRSCSCICNPLNYSLCVCMFVNVLSFESKVFLVTNKGLVMVGCHKKNKKNIMVRCISKLFELCFNKKKIRKRNTVQIVCVNLYFHPLLTIIDIVLVIIFFKCLQCIDIALVV